MKRRTFLASGLAGTFASVVTRPEAGAGTPPAAAPPQQFELDEITVAGLQDGMRSGRWTARRVTELYLERIDAIDRGGPTLRSVIETNPDALAIAAELDTERGQGRIRGPLHGVPVLIKDNIDTGDRMQTTAGSLALEGTPAPRDAFIVERLRAAGAVLLGKTNLSEWANFRGQRSSSGWSARGGQVRNPYVLDRSPCGSSSGSGAAAAANLAALTVGTETDGSIVCPASVNGVVGVKPTVGLWSRSGIIPISATQDTAGPMCRTVTDAALLLDELASADPNDPATVVPDRPATTGYASALRSDALRGTRLGVARQGFGLSDRVLAVFDETLAALRSAGAVLVDPAELPSIDQLGGDEIELFLYELKDGVERYLATRGAAFPLRTMHDIVAFNERHQDRELLYFGQEYLIQAAAKGPITEPRYRTIRRRLRSVSQGNFRSLMTRHRLDAVVCMTGGPAWMIDPVNGDHFTGGSSTYPAVTGYPNVTIPAGQVHGLPVGVSFFGPPWSEGRLLGYAFALEQATQARVKPSFRVTIPN